jgi:hypothetical protein
MICTVCNKPFDNNTSKAYCKCIYRCNICEEVPAKNIIKNNYYCDDCVEFIESISSMKKLINGEKFGICNDCGNETNIKSIDDEKSYCDKCIIYTYVYCGNCDKYDRMMYMTDIHDEIYCDDCIKLVSEGKFCEQCIKYVPIEYEHCEFCGDCGYPNRPH